VPRKEKPYGKMTDKELVRKIFPKGVRKQIEAVLSELNAEKPRRQRAKKKG
jgi:hypothetical protein